MLYNAQGNPIPEAVADAKAVSGSFVRFEAADRADLDVSRQITPEKIDRILTAANAGDTEQQARLSVEVEEKNWDIGQAMATRRAAVAGVPWTIEPPKGMESDPTAKKIAAALTEALDAAGTDTLLSFPDLIQKSLLLALVPGVAVAETVYADGGSRIIGFQNIPAWALTYRDGVRRPLLVTRDTPVGQQLPAGKFIVHSTPGASGDPARGGLIRPLAWLYCFANLNVKDLLTFIERYGMPFLLAKVDANSYDVEKNRLASLIRNFGSAGGAVFTKAVEAELLQGQLGAADVYFKLLDYLSAAVQKLVQGQTATSGAASGWSNGGAQSQVRQDILESDCAALAPTLRRELFAPWTGYNFGSGAPVPRIVFHCEPPADKKALADTLSTLANAGLEAEDPAEVAAVVGIRLRRRAAPAPQLPNVIAASAESADLSTALASRLGVPQGWLKPVADLLADLEAKAADKAVSDADLLAFAESAAARIPELFADMDIAALADVFEKAMGAAAIEGARPLTRESVAARAAKEKA